MNKNSSSSAGDTGNETESEIDPGLGTQDASGDVTLESCREGAFSNKSAECKVTIGAQQRLGLLHRGASCTRWDRRRWLDQRRGVISARWRYG